MIYGLPPRRQLDAPSLSGRRIICFGMARSGLAAAHFLQAQGAEPVVVDQKSASELGPQLTELDAAGLAAIPGLQSFEQLGEFDWLVVSPGVPTDHPCLVQARQQGAEVIGEIELAWRYCPHPIIAVTGTNGKGSTTTMIGEMLSAAGLQVAVAGNIGTPLVSVIEDEVQVVVAEVSSYQLETIDRFHPWAAVLLNISPDHLERHHTLEAYQAAKQRLFMNMGPADLAVLVRDEAPLAALAPSLAATVHEVSVSHTDTHGYLSGDQLMVRLPGDQPLMVGEVSDLALPGLHYVTNAMSAAVVARAAGCPPEAIRAGLQRWQPAPHLLSEVATLGGVRFIDDSKATNIGAAVADLQALKGPVIVIAGGQTKGVDMTPFGEAVARRAQAAYLIGEGAAEIAGALAHRIPVTLCHSLDAAVQAAYQVAQPDTTIILLPACASFDQYQGQADRGEQFAAAVMKLAAHLAAATETSATRTDNTH